MTSEGEILLSGSLREAFSIAGITVELEGELGDWAFELPAAYRDFRTSAGSSHLRLSLSLHETLAPEPRAPAFDSGRHWRVHEGEPAILEFSHLPTSQVLVKSFSYDEGTRFEIHFNDQAWKMLGPRRILSLPYPLEQLLFLPCLAERDGILVHACGAVIRGAAWVFAGHSGDGKTTLGRMLASEGAPLLSDERVALRKEGGRWMAHGTPWPGEGDVVSCDSFPLGGVYVLRKAASHNVRTNTRSQLAAELVARSIVPYYFPPIAEKALSLAHELVGAVPLRELEFARSPGLLSVLEKAA